MFSTNPGQVFNKGVVEGVEPDIIPAAHGCRRCRSTAECERREGSVVLRYARNSQLRIPTLSSRSVGADVEFTIDTDGDVVHDSRSNDIVVTQPDFPGRILLIIDLIQ